MPGDTDGELSALEKRLVVLQRAFTEARKQDTAEWLVLAENLCRLQHSVRQHLERSSKGCAVSPDGHHSGSYGTNTTGRCTWCGAWPFTVTEFQKTADGLGLHLMFLEIEAERAVLKAEDREDG